MRKCQFKKMVCPQSHRYSEREDNGKQEWLEQERAVAEHRPPRQDLGAGRLPRRFKMSGKEE